MTTQLHRRCVVPGCPAIAARGSRCVEHDRDHDRERQARRGNLYDGTYRQRRYSTIRATPYCVKCGSSTRLTADHVIPGDPNSPLRTLCMRCNSGARRNA